MEQSVRELTNNLLDYTEAIYDETNEQVELDSIEIEDSMDLVHSAIDNLFEVFENADTLEDIEDAIAITLVSLIALSDSAGLFAEPIED